MRCVKSGLAAWRPLAMAMVLLACSGDSKLSPPPVVRTVSGVFQATYWVDDGTKVVSKVTRPSPPEAGTQLYALVLGPGGYTRYDGTLDATTGAFTIPNVPGGTYLLALAHPNGQATFIELSATQPDLTAQVNGRPDAVQPSGPTRVLLDVTGLDPWQEWDLLELESSNTPAWLAPFGGEYGPDLAAGSTSVSASFDWAGWGGGLPDATQGDVVFVHQLSNQVVPSGRPGAGTRYRAASRYARLTDVTLADLTGGTIAGALQAAPTKTVNLDVRGAACATLAAQLPAGTSMDPMLVAVMAVPNGNWSTVGSADLLVMVLFAGTDVDFGAVSYGSFLDPVWTEFLEYRCNYSFPVAAAGATYWSAVSFGASSRYPVASPPPLAPALGPPRSPRINGATASQVQTGVGLTPTLSWTAPSSGIPDRYRIDIREVRLANGRWTSLPFIASLRLNAPPAGTTTESVLLPPGVLSAGREYIATVTAITAPDPMSNLQNHSASTVTNKFSP